MAWRPLHSLRRLSRRRSLRWALALGVVGLGVRAVLPVALERAAERFGGIALGRVVEVDNVDLALHRGGLYVDGFRIGGPLEMGGPVAAPVVSLARFATELRWGALLQGRIHLRRIELASPHVSLEHAADGSLTPLVLAEATPAEPAEEGDEPGEPWPLALDVFRLGDALLTLTYEGDDEVELRLAEFTLADFAFADGRVSLGALGLREPQIRVHRELAVGERQIGAAPATDVADAPAAPEAAAGAPGVRIEAIDIERAEFTLVTDAAPLDVAIALSARGLTLDPGERFPVELQLELAGGRIDLGGEVGAVPPGFAGRVEWSQVGIPVLSQALGLELPIRVEQVQSSGAIDVEAALGEDGAPGGLRLVGVVDAKDLVAVVRGTEERVAAELVEITFDSFEMPLGGEAEGPPQQGALVGAVRSEGIAFDTPDEGLGVRVASLSAAELRAALPVGGAPSDVEVAGTVRGGDIEVGLAGGDRVSLGALELALRDLRVPAVVGDPLEVDASARLDALSVASPAQGLDAQVARIDLADLVASLPAEAAPALEAASLRLDRPRVRLTLAASERSGASEPPAAPAASAAPAPDPVARLGRFELRGGTVEVIDQSVEPFARSTLEAIALNAQRIRWPERQIGRFELASRGPSSARFEARGALGAEGEVAWNLSGLPLPHFNPYAKPVGYRVESGSASLAGDIALAGAQLGVDSELVLDQLDLETHRGEEFEDAIGVPVGLAVGLLKDPSGRITLPIRFEADREEVRAQLLPLVLATLRHAVVGAVALPLKALRGLAPDGDDELALPAVASAPGDAAPDVRSLEALAALSQLLAERPLLGVVIRGETSAEDDRPLALDALAEELRAGAPLPPTPELGFFGRRRVAAAVVESGREAPAALGAEDAAALHALLDAQEVAPERYRALAEARAATLRETLVTEYGVAPERLQTASSVGAQRSGATPELVAMGSPLQDASLPAVSADSPTPSDDTP